ncbi:MAG: chromate transporter [Firmicutes bacterium]|nr:chromate transporter [Bacillota bacterium]
MTGILFKLLFTFAKIGLFTFGGGYAMIPLIEKEIIQANKWLSMNEFVDIIAIAEVTPGPVAVNSATYVGYKMAGTLGAAFATTGVILPSFLIVISLASLFLKYKDTPSIKAVSKGLRAAVTAMIASAALSTAKASVIDLKTIIIIGLIVFGIFKMKIHPIICIFLAGILGIALWVLSGATA